MTLEDIRAVLHQTDPFTIRMVSGRIIDVPHPDFVALSKSLTSLIISEDKGRIEFVRLSQIESLNRIGRSSDGDREDT